MLSNDGSRCCHATRWREHDPKGQGWGCMGGTGGATSWRILLVPCARSWYPAARKNHLPAPPHNANQRAQLLAQEPLQGHMRTWATNVRERCNASACSRGSESKRWAANEVTAETQHDALTTTTIKRGRRRRRSTARCGKDDGDDATEHGAYSPPALSARWRTWLRRHDRLPSWPRGAHEARCCLG